MCENINPEDEAVMKQIALRFAKELNSGKNKDQVVRGMVEDGVPIELAIEFINYWRVLSLTAFYHRVRVTPPFDILPFAEPSYFP